MSTPERDALSDRARARIGAVARLLQAWGLAPEDFYVADASVLGLQGYPVPPFEEADARCVVHVNAERLSWAAGAVGEAGEAGEAEELTPPPGTGPREAYESLVQEAGVTLVLVPFTRHAIPITFRKMIEVDGEPLWVASLRALGRIQLNDLVRTAQREGGMRPEEAARFRATAPRLAVLAEVGWPSRDRWFGKFCGELSALVASAGEGAGSLAAKLTRLGRRHALL